MARRQRQVYSSSATISVAAGATDQANVMDLVAPSEGATVDFVAITTKTAGTGTGTFTAKLQEGSTDLTAAGITVDADAAAGTVHGTMIGNGVAATAAGKRISLTTVKTGTVSADATLLVYVSWAT